MNLSLSMSVRQDLSLRQAISQDLKISLRLRLIEGLRGETIQLKLDCGGIASGCGYKLTPAEIVKGFTKDPLDTTTVCPKCERRFQPNLRFVFGRDATGEIHFMCKEQAVHMLKDRPDAFSRMSPEELRKSHPKMYYSLVFHFGSLEAAFRSIGFDYRDMSRKGWEEKVYPFLGEAPDSMIAEIAGVPVSDIRRLRKKHKIKAYVAPEEGEE